MFIYLHPHSRKENDLVAQLVEHITFNQRVAGSSPARGALKTRHLQKCECLFLYLSRTFHEQKYFILMLFLCKNILVRYL